jgi:hypothetical protein
MAANISEYSFIYKFYFGCFEIRIMKAIDGIDVKKGNTDP